MLQLGPCAEKIIPIISTYSQRTGEVGSILSQEKDLRSTFQSIAFRTFENTFVNDIKQIKEVAQSQDYLIIDLEEHLAYPGDDIIIQPILDQLSGFTNCKVIIVSSAIPKDISNKSLDHGKIVAKADNCLLKNYALLYGHGFGDYAGIKKDDIIDGGGISPRFIFFDPIENNYYGYKGTGKPDLNDFENIIVPAVYHSQTAARMQASEVPYLSLMNYGWTLLAKILFEDENGRSQAKFKRISIEHYLHCIRAKIQAGHFN